MRRSRNERFGEWLDVTMSNQRLLGVDLAEQLGVDASAVSKWRTGVSVPDTQTLTEMAVILDVDPVRLYVTAGRVDAATVHAEPLEVPEATADRERIRRQIKRIRGLSDEGINLLLATFEDMRNTETGEQA